MIFIFCYSVVKIGFEKILYSVQEDTVEQEVCIVIHGGSLARLVNLSVFSSDGTAQAPGDYAQVFYLIAYSQSDRERKCINVTIIDDSLVENTETFTLSLLTEDASVSLIQSSLSVMIIDNDKVMLALQETNYTVIESVGQLEVKFEFKGELERNITFSLESNDETASSLSGDYTFILETRSISSESVTDGIISLSVNILDDLKVEGLETFTIQATSSDAAVIFETERRTAVIFIEDDDSKQANSMCVQDRYYTVMLITT